MLVKGSSSLPAFNLQVVEHPSYIIYHLKIVNFCKCKYLK